MGHFGKFISIENGKANCTNISSSIDIVNVGTHFVALSVYARDLLKELSKVGRKGYQIYGFHPYSYGEDIEKEMLKNPLGKGHLNSDSKNIYDIFTPIGSVSINFDWIGNSRKPFESNMEDRIKEANSPFEYIIDYDNEEIAICVENEKDLNYKVKKMSFKELDELSQNEDKKDEMLESLFEIEAKKDRLLITGDELKGFIKENYEKSVKLIQNGDLNNKDNFSEIIKSNMFIFNNCISKEDLAEKIEKDLNSLDEVDNQKKIKRNR